MAVFLPTSRSLFLHVPKTGGTWIEVALKAAGVPTQDPPHSGAVSVRHGLRRHINVDALHVFAFVRHPVAWYESWWKFQAGFWRFFEPNVWHPQRVLEPCASDEFSTFVRNCLSKQPAYVTRMFEWFFGPAGAPSVTLVGRYENLTEDLIRILASVGEPFNEQAVRAQPKYNVSAAKMGQPVWDPELRAQIERTEAVAIRRFYP